METIQDASRTLPVVAEADVIVAGGGPAGVCAAIAAARNGAKTALLESSGCLGGTWTAGALGWIIDSRDKTGILIEIMAELNQLDAVRTRRKSGTHCFQPDDMKVTLERLCREAGVRVRLYTLVAAALKDNTGKLTAIVTESKSGREAWRGTMFIDATGDGDLGALSGCQFQIGNSQNQTQPMSLLALVTGIDTTAAAPFIRNYAERDACVAALRRELQAAGANPSYHQPTLFHLGGDLFFLMSNHQYDGVGTNADDLSQATMEAREEIHRQIQALRSRGGVWQHLELVSTASSIGVREGRRLKGLYDVSLEDLKTGARHDDAVCRPTFCVDVHALDAQTGGIEEPPCKVEAYDIPLRALISADVDNLLMAGRCISGDFYAHASYRVTGNATVLGEAAGVCAALAVRDNVLPRDVPANQFFKIFQAPASAAELCR
jgi:hypothetical protein